MFVHKWHSQLQHCMHQAGPNHSPGRAKRSFLLPSTSRVANVVGFLHTKQQYKFDTNIDHVMSKYVGRDSGTHPGFMRTLPK